MAILDGLGHLRRKGCGKAVTLFIFQDLGAVFGDESLDVNIKHLAGFKVDVAVLRGWQTARSTLSRLISSGSFTLLKVVPTLPVWPPGLLLPSFGFLSPLTKSVEGGLLILRLLRPNRLANNCSTNNSTSNVERKAGIPPQANADFVCAMEDVLEVYQRPYTDEEVLICLDETSKLHIKETRIPLPPKNPTI